MNRKRLKSGKREAGWLIFLIVTSIIGWALYIHSKGVDMSAWVALFVTAWPIAMVAAVGPHVVHHLRPPAFTEPSWPTPNDPHHPNHPSEGFD